ncbi:MAG: hypothetical protein Q4G66_11895 [bacterium]|nr:hypothetical protein [bacterium]
MAVKNSLIGIEDIVAYTGRPWNSVEQWIDEGGFPAAKIDGRWESNTDLIDSYRKQRLERLTGKGQS